MSMLRCSTQQLFHAFVISHSPELFFAATGCLNIFLPSTHRVVASVECLGDCEKILEAFFYSNCKLCIHK